ncbi:MAG: hypothetical protein ACK4N5_11655 [Myxococcales bacterium]
MTTNGMTGESEWNKIAALKGDDDREKFEMGVAYNNIIDHQLAQAAGYRSAAEFIAAKLEEAAKAAPTPDGNKVRELSLSSLYNYGVAARAFDVNAFARYGFTNLVLLQRYRKLANTSPSVPPESTQIHFKDEQGREYEKPFAECTSRELKTAIRALRGPAEPLGEDVEDRLEQLNSAVDSVVGTERRCDVAARASKGEVLLTLSGVPMGQLAEVLEAMLAALGRR